MSEIRLTKEQSDVVFSTEPKLIVQASAGSGKTLVLVETYLKRVMEEGLQPDQILCITFTKKAASEMKQRIVSELRKRGRTREAQIAETGPIQTIHGFCERILRENAIDAAIDPDFQILSESDFEAILDRAIQKALWETPENSLAKKVIHELSGKARFGSKAQNGQLIDPVRKALFRLRGTLVRPAELLKNHGSLEAYLAHSYQSILDRIPNSVRTQFEPGDQSSFWVRLRSAFRTSSEPMPAWMPSARAAETLYDLELESAARSCGIAEIVYQVWIQIESEMEETQRFDFSYLESKAVQSIVSYPRIQGRVRNQYPVVMIDECQDINPIQDQLIQALGGETVLMVGDVKQSIYGFRQADVRIFESRMADTPTLDLTTNFRTIQGVLQSIDELFAVHWDRYRPMSSPESASQSESEGVEIWHCDGFDQTAEWIADLCEVYAPNEIAVLARTGTEIAILNHRLEALGVPVRMVGTGRNFYLRLEVRDLANALEVLANPKNDFALLSVLRSPIVGVTLDTIVKLAIGGNVISKLKEPLENPEDQAKILAFSTWLESISSQAQVHSAWEILANLFAKTPYWENLVQRPNGKQQLANVRKLFSYAAQLPELNASQFAKRLRTMQTLDIREGDAGAVDDGAQAVTIMTVHRSKGLEFPVVVLPSTRVKMKSRKSSFEVDRDAGIIAMKPSGGASAICDWIGERRKQQESEEELRTLYVAMTRSQKKLCIVASPDKKGTLGELIWNSLELDLRPKPGLKILRAQVSTNPI